MRKLLFVLSAVAIVSVSCQKEISLEAPDSDPGAGGGGNTAQGLLTRIAFVAGGDSVVTDYTYDGAQRLATYTSTSTGGDNEYKRIVRNNTGLITSFVTKNDQLLSLGIDSMETNMFYNNVLNQYEYSVSIIDLGGADYRDSTVYDYAGSSLIAKTSYAKSGTSPYIQYQKSEYTYGSGNTLSEEYFTIDSIGAWESLGTYSYAYDAKTNPIKLGVEGIIVLDDGTFFSNNNVSTMSFADPADPSSNFSLATTYIYNNADKPSSGTAIQTPGSGSYTLRYYYN